jgi:hypothetical protein
MALGANTIVMLGGIITNVHTPITLQHRHRSNDGIVSGLHVCKHYPAIGRYAWCKIMSSTVNKLGMVGVSKILNVHLPIPRKRLVRDPRGNADKTRVFVTSPKLLDFGQGRSKWFRKGVKIDENKSVPNFELNRRKPRRFAQLDCFFSAHVRRADEPTFQIVCPEVKRTAQCLLVACAWNYLTPMPANRRHRADFASGRSRHEYWLSGRLNRNAVAGVGHLLDPPDAYPRMREYFIAFEFEKFGRRIAFGWQHLRGATGVLRNLLQDPANDLLRWRLLVPRRRPRLLKHRHVHTPRFRLVHRG